MKKDLVVTLADSNYFDQARQLLSSVHHNSGWKGDYMILAHQMKDEQIEWFDRKGIIVKRIKNFGRSDLPNHPKTVLSKFSLFSGDIGQWNRIIYLDADISVTASLDRLLQLKGFWAVVDFHELKLKGQFKSPRENNFGLEHRRTYGKLASNFDLNRISFNSGVMVFEGHMVGEDTYDHLISLYSEFENITLHDQSILNLLFYDRWRRLPLAFNNYFLYSRRPFSIRFEKCDGIINHYILDRVWKTGNKDHFPVWKLNLDMADGMDLERRPNHSNEWDEIKIKEVSHRLAKSHFRPETFRGRILETATMVDRGISRIGLFIKKKNPRIYGLLHR